jgi:hypothetical protein
MTMMMIVVPSNGNPFGRSGSISLQCGMRFRSGVRGAGRDARMRHVFANGESATEHSL